MEADETMKDIERKVKPYKDGFTSFLEIPDIGLEKNNIIEEMEALKAREESKWKDGFASGAVYHGDDDHIDFLNKIYSMNSQSNPLHSDLWPSNIKYEAEIVSMTANMLGADKSDGGYDSDPEKKICGVVSSGGTESIMLAMKTYRDWARDQKGITEPEMIIPATAHAAFDKSSQYFNIKLIRIPVDKDYKADVAATEKAITNNSIVIVGEKYKPPGQSVAM